MHLTKKSEFMHQKMAKHSNTDLRGPNKFFVIMQFTVLFGISAISARLWSKAIF